jgi:hypothetical protein
LCLAHRTDSGRFVAGAQIATDSASPHRVRQTRITRRRSTLYVPFRFGRSPFWYLSDFFFSIDNFLGNVESAITCIELIEIRIPVITGADDVNVFFLFSFCEPARTCPISIPLFIYNKTTDKILGEFSIRVEMIAPGLSVFF